jgi:hypothetical protein
VLLQSWGIIGLAQSQNWPGRAKRIGELLRSILGDLGADTHIAGLASLIYILSQMSRTMDFVGAATFEACRWLPNLDEGMADKQHLYDLFGPQRVSLRQKLFVRDGRKTCVVCGEMASEEEWINCSRCCGDICSVCEGPDVQRHVDGNCLNKCVGDEQAT